MSNVSNRLGSSLAAMAAMISATGIDNSNTLVIKNRRSYMGIRIPRGNKYYGSQALKLILLRVLITRVLGEVEE